MNEPTKCPECGAYTRDTDGHGQHSPTCSLIGFEEAKEQLKLYNGYFQHFDKRMRDMYSRLSKQVTDWQGRHAILRQENNALRRKLYPKKVCPTNSKKPTP